MKDNFSKDSDRYAKHRPTYPQGLYDFLYQFVDVKEKAWDCATGNGQVALELATVFSLVEASDISQQQLEQAPKSDHINYSVQQAENTNFKENEFDLITVGQAIHWFKFDAFFKEVKRCLKPNGLIAIFGYQLLTVSPEIDRLINEFYNIIIGPYWDEERKYIDEEYKSIPFPFKEIETPKFEITVNWTATDALNYLNTWSAVKHYEKTNKENPVKHIQERLHLAWGNSKRKVIFPMIIKAGKL